MKQVEEAIAENAKGILASTMKQEIKESFQPKKEVVKENKKYISFIYLTQVFHFFPFFCNIKI